MSLIIGERLSKLDVCVWRKEGRKEGGRKEKPTRDLD